MSEIHRLEDYSIEKEIGHGSFATVYKGIDKVDLNPVCLSYLFREPEGRWPSRLLMESD